MVSALVAAYRVALTQISVYVTSLLAEPFSLRFDSRTSWRVQLHGFFGAFDTAVGDIAVEKNAVFVGEWGSALGLSKHLCMMLAIEV